MIKIIVLNQVITNIRHVRNSDGGHLVYDSHSNSYVVADKPFEISYNEAAILRKYNKNSSAYKNVDFNDTKEWESYCRRFQMKVGYWQGGGTYETGIEQSWDVSREESTLLLDELSMCSPNKFALYSINNAKELKDGNKWFCYFLSLEIEKVFNKYIAESRNGCKEIQERIWEKNRKIKELKESIKLIEDNIEVEKDNLKEQEKNNLIRLLCEKKLNYKTSFPPTLGFEGISPVEFALTTDNKTLFMSFYENNVCRGENDILCLLLKYGLFEKYNLVKKTYVIYEQHKAIFELLHLFYAIYHLDLEELYHIIETYKNNKKFLYRFFENYYEDKYMIEIEYIVNREEIRYMIYEDYMSNYQEWVNDVSNGDEKNFKSDFRFILFALNEELSFEDLHDGHGVVRFVSNWFLSRLSDNEELLHG